MTDKLTPVSDKDREIIKGSIKEKIKKSGTKLYPVSDKDIDRIKGDSSKQKESGSNTYAKDNQAAIKKLKA